MKIHRDKTITDHYQRDEFYYPKYPTVVGIRAIFEWVNKRAMRMEVTMLDCNESFRKQRSDTEFEEVVGLISGKTKQFFRVILRKNQNWFLLLTSKKHIEDLIEVVIRGIDVGPKEYFISCFLKKEYMSALKNKFSLVRL